MTVRILYKSLNYFIATIWFANGFLCKVLNLVPRHQQIVSEILGNDYATVFTKLIGVSEMLMALWILSGIKSRFNAMSQILIITTMNTLEFIFVPDLLLWGKYNSLFAFIFIGIIFYNEFILHKKLTQQS